METLSVPDQTATLRIQSNCCEHAANLSEQKIHEYLQPDEELIMLRFTCPTKLNTKVLVNLVLTVPERKRKLLNQILRKHPIRFYAMCPHRIQY